jgi:DNA polymerase-3 subunit beta
MKFKISKDKLLDGLQLVQGVCNTRTTLPILGNVLIKSNGSGIHLTTTDLDVGLRCTVEAEIQKGGAATLPARRLAAIVRELPPGDVLFEVDERNAASITSGQVYFKILGLPESEFPPLPLFEEAKTYTLKQSMLKDALNKVSFAVSVDETRYVLNGALFSFKDDKLTIVATDGRRLALFESPMMVAADIETTVVIPSKAINQLERVLTAEGDVEMKLNGSQVSFALNDKLLVSKIIKGNYPRYQMVIPTESKERIELDRKEFLAAVHRVALLASDKANAVVLAFSKNSIEIRANSPEIGEAKEVLAVKFSGKEFSIKFNPNYLMDPFDYLEDETLFLELTDDAAPGVVKSGTDYLYVLMPMRA